MEFLVVFLNSKLFRFCFKEYFPELLGETRELRKVFFETIAVKLAEDVAPYKKILKEILQRKQQKEPIADLASKVDELVFNLYNLNDSERKMIDNAIV
ncbi:MAG: hypothetical protein U0T84_05975 [Chitinophagales bacterium]